MGTHLQACASCSQERAVLHGAYRSASFHPNDLRSWEDFHRIPLVTKDQVIANFPERILAKDFKLDELVVSRSSGSSGKVLDIAYDDRAMIIYMLAGLRLYRMGFAYRPWQDNSTFTHRRIR
jgi:phenylacetate-coenzyme A ligase PaaK-like adenylate-forming protein